MAASNRFQGLKPAIAEKIRLYEDREFTYDEPIPFCGLEIYPITMRHYNEFLNVNSCLLLDRTSDIKGLRMTNLEYLLSKMKDVEGDDLATQEARLLSYKFSRLIELVFHTQMGVRCKRCGKVMSYLEYAEHYALYKEMSSKNTTGEPIVYKEIPCDCGKEERDIRNWENVLRYGVDNTPKKKPTLILNGQVITSADFDLFRQVVMYQNLPDYFDDSWIDPNIREDHNAKMELQRKSNPVSATTELKMLAVAESTGYKLEDVYNLPIRKFLLLLNLIDDKLTYTTTRIGVMSGMVSLKEPIEHWLYKKETDVYGDSYKTLDQVQADVEKLG